MVDTMILRNLKDVYNEANSTCEHKRTHPHGCDDCEAKWCDACFRYHQNPINLGCKFSQMLAKYAIDLINLSLNNDQVLNGFIRDHHNPIVYSLNEQIKKLEKQSVDKSSIIRMLEEIEFLKQKLSRIRCEVL